MLEIKTPALKHAYDLAIGAIAGLQSGEKDHKTVALELSGSRTIQGIVKHEIQARFAAPKIAAQEAKLIEQTQQRTIEHSA